MHGEDGSEYPSVTPSWSGDAEVGADDPLSLASRHSTDESSGALIAQVAYPFKLP
jgi:hypothetical protein